MKKFIIIMLFVFLAGCAVTNPKGEYDIEISDGVAPFMLTAGATLAEIAIEAERSGLTARFDRGESDVLYLRHAGKDLYRLEKKDGRISAKYIGGTQNDQ